MDPNYLADEHDMRVSVAGFKAIRMVFEASALEGLLREERLPGAEAPSMMIGEKGAAMVLGG